jgi:RHS repeat-associated protein
MFGVAPWTGALPANGTAYEYDSDGKRIAAESDVTVGSTSTTTLTDSTWDTQSSGNIPLNINDAVTTSANPGVTTNISYIYGPLLFGGTAPIEQITGSTATFLVSNPTGVQAALTSSGALLEKAVYSSYGLQAIQTGSEVTPFGFQGSYRDTTGLIYLINRYYDPTTDQFMSVDPKVATTNQPYVFTNDNPLNAVDPLGNSWIDDGPQGLPTCFGVSSGVGDGTGGVGGDGGGGGPRGGGGGDGGGGDGGGGERGGGGDGGDGNGSKGSTGRTQPKNETEAKAMERAKESPTVGKEADINMGDSRWPGDEGWVKMTRKIDGVEIHWNLNVIFGGTDDWKFVN